MRSVLAAVLLVGALAITPVGTAVGVTADSSSSLSDVNWQVSPPANNSTTTPPHQENPDKVGENGDTDAMAEWLSSRLSERLGNSTLQISQGQYEDAQGVLGDEYNDTLAKYIDVAGETDTETDDQQVTWFKEARTTQSEYGQTVSEYQETYEAYKAARQNGNDGRARELARELRTLSTDLDRLSSSLIGSYQNLSETSEYSFQNETEVITNQTQTITQQTEAATTDVFTETSITLDAESQGSFVDPIQITGRVSANGSVPTSGLVRIRIHDQVFETDVGNNGSFQFSYNPLTVPTGEIDGVVAYIPVPDGVYLGSEAAMRLNVTQTEPALEVAEAPSTVRFQEPITVSGRVTAGGRAVPNTTVRLHLAGRQIAQIQTNTSGYYQFSPGLPGQIEPGAHQLTVHAGAAGTALLPTTKQTSLTVTETETSLTISTTHRNDSIQVRGRLKSIDGVGIPNQSITITRNGSVLQSLQTNASGQITSTIEAPRVNQQNVTVSVGAAFDGSGTNLQSTNATTTVVIPGRGPLSVLGLPLPFLALAGSGLLGLAAVSYAVMRYRSSTAESAADSSAESAPTPTSSDSIPDSGRGREEGAATPVAADVAEQLATAATHLDDDAVEPAVRALYSAVRSAYAPDDEVARTHWEFFSTVSDDLPPEARATLRAVTEVYEGVQFADNPPTPNEVADLLTEARTQLDVESVNRNPHQPADPSAE
jgi:hypothetical protein